MNKNDNQDNGAGQGLGNIGDIAGEILQEANQNNPDPAQGQNNSGQNNPNLNDDPDGDDLEAQRLAAQQAEEARLQNNTTLADVLDEEGKAKPKPVITDKDKGNQPTDDTDFGDEFLEIQKQKPEPKPGESQDPAPVELPQETKVKLAEYDEIFKDDFLATIIKARLAGDDITKIVTDLQPIDVNKLTPEEIIERNCQIAGLSTEEIEKELDYYSEIQSPLQKKKYLEEQRTSLAEREKSRTAGVLKNAGSNAERQIQIRDQYISGLQAETKKLEGREMYGHKITAEDAKAIYDFGVQFNPVNPDGTINSKLISQIAFARVLLPVVAKKNHAVGHTQGQADILDQVSRPDAGGQPSNTRSMAPQTTSGQKLVEAADKALGG